MTNVITSNQISIKGNIRSYQNNFIICHLYTKNILVTSSPLEQMVFDIYYQDGMDLETNGEEYENTDTMKFNFHPVPTITSAFDMISSEICDMELDAEDENENQNTEIFRCFIACQYSWNQAATAYFRNQFEELQMETPAENIFRCLKLPSMERLVNLLKVSLNTTFIYPDDPISFSYAIYKALGKL